MVCILVASVSALVKLERGGGKFGFVWSTMARPCLRTSFLMSSMQSILNIKLSQASAGTSSKQPVVISEIGRALHLSNDASGL